MPEKLENLDDLNNNVELEDNHTIYFSWKIYKIIERSEETLWDLNYNSEFTKLKEQLKIQNNFSWKEIICFVWAPWAWKTTQIKLLQDMINPDTFHMSSFVKSIWKRTIVEQNNARWELIQGYENKFLNSVWESKNAFCILDWFPRNEEQVILLYKKALELWWNIKIIYLTFKKNNTEEKSLERQITRSKLEKKDEKDEKRLWKLKRYFLKDKKAISRLEYLSTNFIKIDAENNINDINDNILKNLWMDTLRWKFDQKILEYVSLAEKRTWVEMWLWAWLIYRNYFNWNFWPIRDSFDKDIHINNLSEIEKWLKTLEEINTFLRWSVDSRVNDTISLYWIQSNNLKEALVTFPLTFRQVWIKLNKKWQFSIIMTYKAKYDLENGIIRIDEELLEKVPESKKQWFIDRAITRANKVLQEYPWLKVEWILKELYNKKYWTYNKLAINLNIPEIIDSINDLEFWWKKIWRIDSINEEQIILMNKIVKFYRDTSPRLNLVEYPKKWNLPKPWDYLMNLKEKSERGEELTQKEKSLLSSEYIPEWFNSQLEYVSTLKDWEFNEWFFNQIRSRKPLWWKDEFISKCISYMTYNYSKSQKPTHLWLPLYIHSIDTVWQLKTDNLINTLSKLWYNKNTINSIRRSMRIWMFLHDIWKTKNSLTPWCHEWVWIKIWSKIAPEWISNKEKEIISWIIWTHDVFWRLSRSITEKEVDLSDINFNVLDFPIYKWAIDPQKALNIIKSGPLDKEIAFEISKEIWIADISSVSALSWVKFISDTLFEIIEIEMKKA